LKAAAETPESRFYRLILERALSSEVRQQCHRWLDVGCRNWSYLSGALEALPAVRQGIGIELDPGRIYWNGFYRGNYAHAEAARACSQTRTIHFLGGDFTKVPLEPELRALNEEEKEYPALLVTHFFPFVSAEPCRAWGLPKTYSNFDALIARTQALCHWHRPRTVRWLSLHQGEWEAEIARPLWEKHCPIESEGVLGPLEFQALWPGKHPVIWLAGTLSA